MATQAEAPAPDVGAGSMELGGRAYLVRVRVGDLMAIRKRLHDQARKQAAQRAARATTDPLTMYAELAKHPAWQSFPDAVKAELAREAAEAKKKALDPDRPPDVSDEDALALAGEPDNVAFAFWLFARHDCPGLKLEDVRPHVTEDNALDLFVELARQSGWDSLGKAPGRSGS